jgi:hypothetical protein
MPRWLVALSFSIATLGLATPSAADIEPIAWCQGDAKCIRRSERAIPLFAKETRQTESELRDTLNDCEGGPVSRLAFCGWYSKFAAEVDMKDQLQRLASTSTKACAKTFLAKQRKWEVEKNRRCESEALEDFGYWGHRQKELLQICLEKANDERSEKLAAISKCAPCSLCD